MWLRQSTAITLKVGPFLDDSDGVTPETALTINQSSILLSKNGLTLTQKNETSAAVHDTNGYYGVNFNTNDTNTLGRLKLTIFAAGALPVWQDFMVVPANVWDSFFGVDYLQTDVREISGDAPAADNLEADYDGTGYTKTNSTVGTVTTLSSAPTNFSSLVIDGNGAVDALVQGFLNTLLTETTGGRIAGNFDTFFENADAATTRVVDNVGAGGMTTTDVEQLRYRIGIDGTTDTPITNTPNLGILSANITQISGDSAAADNLEADYDGTGYSRPNSTLGTVTTVTNAISTALTASERTEIADAVLSRDLSAVSTPASRSLLNAIRLLRNRWTAAGGSTLTVYQEDDSTIAWTKSVTTDPAAENITGFGSG